MINGINKATKLLLKKAKDLTPEDTYKLQKNNKEQKIENTNWIISWWLINTTPYAKYVEYWVGRKYNYYKWSGRRRGWKPFYSWVGARMYSKTQFENQTNVRNIIIEEINKWIQALNK